MHCLMLVSFFLSLFVRSAPEPTGVPKEGIGILSLSEPPGVRQQPLLFLAPVHPAQTPYLFFQRQPRPQAQQAAGRGQ